MKKLGFWVASLGLFCVIGNGFAAGGTCPAYFVDFDGNQDADDNEFIYDSYAAFLEARDNINGNCDDGCALKKGHVAECDDQFCAGGSGYFTITGNEIFEGKQVSKDTLFVCNVHGFDDVWQKVGLLKPCGEFTPKTQYKRITLVNTDAHYVLRTGSTSYSYCIGSEEMLACLKDPYAEKWTGTTCLCHNNSNVLVWNKKACVVKQADERGDDAVQTQTCSHPVLGTMKIDEVKQLDCSKLTLSGFDTVKQYGKTCWAICMKDGSKTMIREGATECLPGYNKEFAVTHHKSVTYYKQCTKAESNLEKCLKTRNTSEGKACCYLSSAVATWDGQNCRCVAPDYKFEILPNGRGNCKAPVDNVTPVACREQRQTDTGKACCDIEEQKIGSYNAQGDRCFCNDADMDFKIVDAKGQCVAKPVASENHGGDGNGKVTVGGDNNGIICNQNQMNILNNAKDSPNLSEQGKLDINNALMICANNTGDINIVYSVVNNIINNNYTIIYQEDIGEKVRNMKRDLATIESGFKASVWKTAEGNFNGSRLASDSIAGVVLGTAGGLITSNVIKKNQVKSGFENVQCTVGGQSVAGWGDSFSVGIR